MFVTSFYEYITLFCSWQMRLTHCRVIILHGRSVTVNQTRNIYEIKCKILVLILYGTLLNNWLDYIRWYWYPFNNIVYVKSSVTAAATHDSLYAGVFKISGFTSRLHAVQVYDFYITPCETGLETISMINQVFFCVYNHIKHWHHNWYKMISYKLAHTAFAYIYGYICKDMQRPYWQVINNEITTSRV